MKFLFLQEILRLLFKHCDQNPEQFISIFDVSNCLIAFDYDCMGNTFTGCSLSFTKILGYNLVNIVDDSRFHQKIVHPHDKLPLNHFLDTEPALMVKPPVDGTMSIERIKCRARHMKGYWKYLILFSLPYRNAKNHAWHKIGLIADEHKQSDLMDPQLASVLMPGGGKYHSKHFNVSNSKVNGKHKISPRESEILELISQGQVAKEIAEKLNISLSTVITHRKNLIAKFDAHNTAELVKKATQLMLI